MEPNWKPLESRLGPAQCAGFMFMGRVTGVNHYKHRLSRRYLFLDDEGRAYEAAAGDGFREIPFEEALARVTAPLTEMDEALEAPHDSAGINRMDGERRRAHIEVLLIRIVLDD